MRFNPPISAVLALIACLGVHELLERLPEFVALFLTAPSAAVASLLSGAPLSRGADGALILIVSGNYAQKMTSACSGAGFFSLLVGVAIWSALLETSRDRLTRALPALLAYPFAIGANACRISLSAPVAAASEALLDPKFNYIVHMALGALVFLLALVAFNLLIDYARNHRPSPAEGRG